MQTVSYSWRSDAVLQRAAAQLLEKRGETAEALLLPAVLDVQEL